MCILLGCDGVGSLIWIKFAPCTCNECNARCPQNRMQKTHCGHPHLRTPQPQQGSWYLWASVNDCAHAIFWTNYSSLPTRHRRRCWRRRTD